MSAPRLFSLVENTVEMLAFVKRARALHERLPLSQWIGLDMRSVERVAADGVVFFLALIDEFRDAGRSFLNLDPSTPSVLRQLEESGFFTIIKPLGRQRRVAGRVFRQGFRRKSAIVQPDIALAAIDFSSLVLWSGEKRRHTDLYKAIIECMSNTNNHASGPDGRYAAPRWSLSVSESDIPDRVCFSFIDPGVGIYRSANVLRILRPLYDNIPSLMRSERVLEQIMTGKLASSTKLAYRGKGLPKLRELAKQGKLANLQVITNSVVAKISADAESYERIQDAELSGTFLYWEITKGSGWRSDDR